MLETLQGFFLILGKEFPSETKYDQVLDVLETNSVSSVDALASPTLDLAIINQISNPQSKKYVQERDKEMVSVLWSLLNATGPLRCLHDALKSNDNINVSNKVVKLMLEQALCLLGSANYQISVLRRKKVLAAINKAKVNLGDLPLPIAKGKFFGDDFPSLASKQADLSRGLSKNLSSNARRQFSSSTQRFAPLTPGLLPLQLFTFFVLKGRPNKNQAAPTSVGANNFRSRSVKYCKGF